MHQDQLRNIARDSIQELAPNETMLFDSLWSEVTLNPELLSAGDTKSDRHLGAGVSADVTLISLIVIPTVIAIGRDLGGAAAKQIVEYIKKRLGMVKQAPSVCLSDEDIARVADAIASRFQAGR